MCVIGPMIPLSYLTACLYRVIISLKKCHRSGTRPPAWSVARTTAVSQPHTSATGILPLLFSPGVLKEGFSSLQKALNPSPSTMLVCLIRSQAHIRAIASVQRCHFAVFMTGDLKAVIRLSFGNSLASSSLTAWSGSSWCSLHFENLLCWRVEHVVSWFHKLEI